MKHSHQKTHNSRNSTKSVVPPTPAADQDDATTPEQHCIHDGSQHAHPGKVSDAGHTDSHVAHVDVEAARDAMPGPHHDAPSEHLHETETPAPAAGATAHDAETHHDTTSAAAHDVQSGDERDADVPNGAAAVTQAVHQIEAAADADHGSQSGHETEFEAPADAHAVRAHESHGTAAEPTPSASDCGADIADANGKVQPGPVSDYGADIVSSSGSNVGDPSTGNAHPAATPTHDVFEFADDYGADTATHLDTSDSHDERGDAPVPAPAPYPETSVNEVLICIYEPLKHADNTAHVEDYFHFA
jgi:hypothetical protein